MPQGALFFFFPIPSSAPLIRADNGPLYASVPKSTAMTPPAAMILPIFGKTRNKPAGTLACRGRFFCLSYSVVRDLTKTYVSRNAHNRCGCRFSLQRLGARYQRKLSIF